MFSLYDALCFSMFATKNLFSLIKFICLLSLHIVKTQNSMAQKTIYVSTPPKKKGRQFYKNVDCIIHENENINLIKAKAWCIELKMTEKNYRNKKRKMQMLNAIKRHLKQKTQLLFLYYT